MGDAERQRERGERNKERERTNNQPRTPEALGRSVLEGNLHESCECKGRLFLCHLIVT